MHNLVVEHEEQGSSSRGDNDQQVNIVEPVAAQGLDHEVRQAALNCI
jgi:hypothetical protein